MSHRCFIHSSTDGHLGCFYILVIENNAAMNTGVLMFFQISILGSFGYISRNGIGRSKGRSLLVLWGISILLSTMAAPICIPTNNAKGFPFLHILNNTCCLLVYWLQPSWQVWDGISLWFEFAFLWWLVTLSTFSCLLAICVSSLE